MGIILASSSPRRRELMALITPDYTVRTSDVDERAIRAETPALLAQKLAAAKCRAVAESCPEDVVIGCDTVVDVDGGLWMWGNGASGQLGNGEAADAAKPQKVLDGVAQAACGTSHTLILKQDGTVWAWGSNAQGQIVPTWLPSEDGTFPTPMRVNVEMCIRDRPYFALAGRRARPANPQFFVNSLTPPAVGK